MEKYRKRVSIKLLVLMVVLSVFCLFTACKTTGGTSSGQSDSSSSVPAESSSSVAPPAAAEMTLNYTENKIAITSSFYLEAKSGKQRLEGVRYSSSDATIVSVTADGKVTGEKLGAATITATLGEMEETCLVTVETGEILPMLVLENVKAGESVQIDENSTLDLSGYVALGAKTLTDGKISYTLSNPAAGEVVNGVFFPNLLGNGVNVVETTVTATAKWRGIESPLLTEQITVKIIPSTEDFAYLTINGSTYTDEVTLYTTDSFEGETYPTKFTYEYGIVDNGKPVYDLSGVSVSVKSGEGVVNASLGRIDSVASGSAVVELQYSTAQGVKATLEIDVNVIYPIEKHATVIENVSAADGFSVPTEIMNTNTVIKAVQNLGEEDEKVLSVSNGKIYGLETNSKGLTETWVTFYNDDYAYTAKVTGYEGIITTAAQLEELLAWYGDSETYRQEVYDATTFKQRYFVLGADIELVTTKWHGRFYDILDGQGHSVTVTGKTSARGVFGIVEIGAVVKNIAFNFLGSVEDQADDRQTQIATLAMYYKGTLENVYINVDWLEPQEKAVKAIAGYIYQKQAEIKNVYIRVSETTVIPEGTTKGYGYLAQNYQAGTLYENVYVVTESIDGAVVTGGEESVTYYASNETGKENTLEGVYKYATATEMAEAGTSKVGNWSINADGTATYVE